MKTLFQPIESAAEYWRMKSDAEGEIRWNWLLAIASEGVRRIITREQRHLKMCLITVNDNHGELPKDFGEASIVACVKDDTQEVLRGHMVQWIYDQAGSDCDLEVNLICPECHQEKCDHNTPIAVLETDKLFQQSYPEIFMQNYKFMAAAVGPKADVFVSGGVPGSPTFELMRPMPSTSSLAGSNYHLKGCPNLILPELIGPRMYRLSPPHIITDNQFVKGQILLVYAGYVMDDNGLFMIPDIPEAYEAVEAYIDAAVMKRRYLRRLETPAERAYNNFRSERDQLIARARSKLRISDSKSWIEAINEGFNIKSSSYFYGN